MNWAMSRMPRPLENSDLDAPVSTDIDLPCKPISMPCGARGFGHAHFTLRVGPCADQHTHREEHNAKDLQHAVTLAANDPCQHCRDAAKTAENDVHRHTDVVCERPVVQHVDAKEHECNERPSGEWHIGSLDRGARAEFELRRVGKPCSQHELEQGDDQACFL